MLTSLFCAALAFALLFPNTQAGRWLKDLLIDLPARQLAKLTLPRIVCGVIVIAAMASLIAFAKNDGLFVVAQSVPDAIVWFTAFDVATYVDVIGLLLLMAAAVRVRAVLRVSRAVAARSWRWLMHRAKQLQFSRLRVTERGRRTHKTTPPPSDEDEQGWCAPAYPTAFPSPPSVGATPAAGRDVLSKWWQTSFRPPRIGCARVFQRSRSPDARRRAVSHDAKAARTAFVESRLVVKHGEMLAVGFAG